MARAIKNVHLDRAQEKQKKQKKLLIGLSAVFLLAMVYEVPHTMKLMHHTAKPPVVSAQGAAPAVNPQATTTTQLPPQAAADQAAAGAQSGATTANTAIVTSVAATPDTGQLTQFERFASKDPFLQSVQKIGASSSSTSTQSAAPKAPTGTTATKPATTPPAPPPGSAVISVNGELMSVNVNTDFPTQGTVFSQVGAPLFHLVSLTQKTAKVAIAGGSYADGAPTITLNVGQPLTLQNTADGTRYTLLLEPQGTPVTQVTGSTGAVGSTTAAPATSTTPSVVPSTSSDG
jgi:hypothetical protein